MKRLFMVLAFTEPLFLFGSGLEEEAKKSKRERAPMSFEGTAPRVASESLALFRTGKRKRESVSSQDNLQKRGEGASFARSVRLSGLNQQDDERSFDSLGADSDAFSSADSSSASRSLSLAELATEYGELVAITVEQKTILNLLLGKLQGKHHRAATIIRTCLEARIKNCNDTRCEVGRAIQSRTNGELDSLKSGENEPEE